MFELSIRGDIASAHFLRGYDGQCSNLHGHTWKVEVVVAGQDLDAIGLVADFVILKKRLKKILDEMDHGCLNELPYFKEINPTTENIAKYIYQGFSRSIAALDMKYVQVWESDNASVKYYE